MKSRIVVPLDGSANSERALMHALALVRAFGSELHLVRVSGAGTSSRGPWLLPYSIRADVARFFVAERAREQAYLDAVASRVRDRLDDATVTTALLEGSVARSIVAYSRRRKARTIVMSTHGSSGSAGGMLLGSVADRVARFAGLPVLLVRPRLSSAGISHGWRCDDILVPLDGSELAQTILEHVTTLGLALGSLVTLVRVVNSGTSIECGYSPLDSGAREAETHLALVAQQLHANGLRVELRVVYGNWPAADAILQVARDINADLIAIATRGRGGAKRLAFGSVASALLRRAASPTLVLEPNEGSVDPADDSAGTTAAVFTSADRTR